MAAKKNSDAMKTYLMDLSGGRMRRITVPASWKVTFGPLIPNDKYGNERGKYCLRFYESKDQQRAIFTDVVAFRDASLAIEERVTKTKQQTIHKDGPTGRREAVVEARVTEWRNPDSPQDVESDKQFLAIASDVRKAEEDADDVPL
jgi:hypothetical protein